MALVTFETLKSAVLARAQMDEDDPAAALLDRNINDGVKWMRETLLRHRQAGLLVSSTPGTFTTVRDVQTVSLPSDFEGLARVSIKIGGIWRNAIEYEFADSDLEGTTTAWQVMPDGRVNARYCLLDDKLFFQDPPDGAYSGRIWYVPMHDELTADADTVNLYGHDAAVIDYAAMRMLDDNNLPSAHLEKQVTSWDKKIERLAKRRNRGGYAVTRDVTGATANIQPRFRSNLP